MGIQGLLPLLKSIHRPTELKKFEGETFGVDAYGWLHRGAISCAIELAQGKPTRKYVDFAMNRVRMVKHFGVTPYLVFDGDFLPSKAATEASRSKRREDGRKLGLELLKAGKPSQAHQELQKAIDVTPEMARHLIEALKEANIPYVVAPYEADAQLVYLERQGITSGIISEDSDLLVFGAKRLITKLDQYGQCVEVNRRDLNSCREVSFVGWDDRLFRQMAILSGCDYLDSIPSLGLKTAHRLLRKHKTVDRIVRTLQFEGKHRIPADYLTLFRQAEQTFLYQWAFCPTSKQLVNLTTLPPDLNLDQLPFVGSFVEPRLAQRIAAGDVNPITKQEIILSTLPSPRKRAASTTHRSPATRLQSTRDTPKKPIDAYFKDHRRIPLAEMDSNCFHVNPERVTREGTQPIVFPLPRPYIDGAEATAPSPSRNYIDRGGRSSRIIRRRTEPVTNLLTNHGHTLTSVSRRITTGLEARLCNEDAALGPGPGKERSRFFSPNGPKAQAVAKGEGYLMSDDSIEEALRELPDMEGWAEPPDRRRTIAVFEGDRSPQSTSGPAENDERAGPGDTPDPAFEQLATIIPDTPPKSAFSRFAYDPSTLPYNPQPPTLQRRQSSMSSTRRSLVSSTPQSTCSSQPSTTETTPTSTPRLTPLQQLEKRALSQGRESPTSHFAVPRAPKRSSLGRMSLDSIPVNPAFVPLPPVDVAELEVLNGAVGSEDLLVPDSETEELEVTTGLENMNPTGKMSRRKTMDLSQYRFSLS
ncbi:putative exo1 protein [Rosellinia necatrix]|uniref:Putative exo1 protein n=1 Tax=Rosellinia necatrix TaxID=77044 RepID=A0A1S7UNL3_ROSNE|nr:putative exo1 protein [Rosellinia necatrix]